LEVQARSSNGTAPGAAPTREPGQAWLSWYTMSWATVQSTSPMPVMGRMRARTNRMPKPRTLKWRMAESSADPARNLKDRGPQGAGGSALGGSQPPVHDDLPCLHHPPDARGDGPDVGERISLYGHDVRRIAGRERAELFLLAQERGAVHGRGSERLRRGHARFDEPLELARVLAAHREERVGAHRHLHLRPHGATQRLQISPAVLVQPRDRGRVVAEDRGFLG